MFSPGEGKEAAHRVRFSCQRNRGHLSQSFRDGPKDQTSDAQLRIRESRDSGFDAEPVIGPRFARTRWHRPGMTVAVAAPTSLFKQRCFTDTVSRSRRASTRVSSKNV